MKLPAFDVDDETGRYHTDCARVHCGGDLRQWLAIVARESRGQDYEYAVEQERKWRAVLARRKK